MLSFSPQYENQVSIQTLKRKYQNNRMGHFFHGSEREKHIFPLIILHFASAVSQWEYSDFCFPRPTISPQNPDEL